MRPRFAAWGILAAVLAAAGLYLGLSAAQGGLGFPLDDAWIHQTYARNLVRDGRWAFVPGVSSSGSTSPFWTILLAVGYWLKLPYRLWTYGLGSAALWLLAAGGMRLWRLLWPDWADKAWLAGVGLALTFPLTWAAFSGMETLLFSALGLWVLALAIEERTSWRETAVLGMLSGLLILTRPDGVIVVGLAGVALLWSKYEKRKTKRDAITFYVLRFAFFALFTILPLIPYLWFNWQVSGLLWPNTLYAKQTEYAVLQARPLISRFVNLLYFSLGGPAEGWRGMSGAFLLLLPGLFAALNPKSEIRNPKFILPLAWAVGHVLAYAWRLPVTYQHGRYLLPIIPVWVVYGLAGWFWIFQRMGHGRLARVGKRSLALTGMVIWIIFLLLGAQAYAADVAFIEGEMVTVAKWLSANTEADALIAAHDIGAIGYFSERPLLDLAGLVSPEIIPWLADEARLAAYIRNSDADFLVTAPGWPYDQVVGTAVPLFDTDYVWTREQGFNNMAVYGLRP